MIHHRHDISCESIKFREEIKAKQNGPYCMHIYIVLHINLDF